MPMPKYDAWKAATHQTRFGFQTSEFKKLDAAVKKYDLTPTDTNKEALKTAFNNWKDKDNKFDWKKSMRNETGMLETLHDFLFPYREAAKAWTAPALPTTPEAGKFYLAQSFQFANSKQRVDVPKAFDRAKLLINSAYLGITQAGIPGTRGRRVYERWFGTYDAANATKVRGVINAVHGALHLRGVVLYYRGPGATGPNDCPAETEDITEEDFFGAAWRPSQLPAALDKKFTYIFLGSDFFTSGEFKQDSIAGVIIHELTHAICGTKDELYNGAEAYGADVCKDLAIHKPRKAINNADSYEFFCENFQDEHFVPRARRLHLPAKASITLNL